MIIVGYQGIGKSTLCRDYEEYIDLESSWTKVNGVRSSDWAKVYANIAVGLSEQGYVVFTASHKVVREELRKHSEPVVVICPSIKLKNWWIGKLSYRYEATKLDKDLAAWKNAEECYEKNINDLIADKDWARVITLDRWDYDLYSIILDITDDYDDSRIRRILRGGDTDE